VAGSGRHASRRVLAARRRGVEAAAAARAGWQWRRCGSGMRGARRERQREALVGMACEKAASDGGRRRVLICFSVASSPCRLRVYEVMVAVAVPAAQRHPIQPMIVSRASSCRKQQEALRGGGRQPARCLRVAPRNQVLLKEKT